MQCPYCDTVAKETEGGFPDRCGSCGAWFLLKDQIKDWQITIAMVRDCLDHVGMLGNLDCAEEHKNCAQSLEAMIHEMDRFIKVLLMKK
jgi:hypothetical protein